GQPFYPNSAAAAARVIDLKPGDRVLAATDPDDDAQLTPLKRDEKQRTTWADLAQRLRDRAGKPIRLKVLRAGKDEEEAVDLRGEGRRAAPAEARRPAREDQWRQDAGGGGDRPPPRRPPGAGHRPDQAALAAGRGGREAPRQAERSHTDLDPRPEGRRGGAGPA